jgi:ankyrin repeat protein
MPARQIPSDPSLEHLRKEAKRLRDAVRAGDADARALVREFHPRAERALARGSLADAQLVTARSYGFASWPRLRQHLAAIEPFVWNPPAPLSGSAPLADVFVRLACLVYGDWHRSNPAKAQRLLADHPELARADIYCAAAAGDVASVRGMIDDHPAVVRAKGGPLRWEPLLYACYSRMEATRPDRSTLEVARLLLARGADPNAGMLWGANYAFTALTGAFGEGEDGINQPPHPESLALARLLLEAGADPNDAQTLYNRHFKENDEHLELLFAYGLGRDTQNPWLQRTGDRPETPATLLTQQLCWAAMRDFPRRVRLLVERGVDVNAPSPRSGRTAYEEAVRAGSHAIAEYLLEHGAKKIGLDPLETFALACIAGRRDEVHSRLAQDPALLEKLGAYGRVDLLHRAVEARKRDGIRLIVELGVDVNGMMPGTGLDRSVLHNAAGWGGVEMVRYLMELGADPGLRDPTYHATPLGWALYNQQREVVEYLLPLANIFDAVQSGGVERAAALLREDPSLAQARDAAGNPLVFYLRPGTERLEPLIQLLLAHGADLNARDRRGRTILDAALGDGDGEFAGVLRSHGANRLPIAD